MLVKLKWLENGKMMKKECSLKDAIMEALDMVRFDNHEFEFISICYQDEKILTLEDIAEICSQI